MIGSRLVRRALLGVILAAIVVRVVRWRRIARAQGRARAASRARAAAAHAGAHAGARSGAAVAPASTTAGLQADQGGAVPMPGVPGAAQRAHSATRRDRLQEALNAPKPTRPPLSAAARTVVVWLAAVAAAVALLTVLAGAFVAFVAFSSGEEKALSASEAEPHAQRESGPRETGPGTVFPEAQSMPVPQAGPAGTATPYPQGREDPPASPAPTAHPRCAVRPVVADARPLSPAISRAVNRQWTRIEGWLRTNAPRSYASLRPPAKARTLAVAEAQMGLRLPDDLRASLLRHNGSAGPAAFGLGTAGSGTGTPARTPTSPPATGPTSTTGPTKSGTPGAGLTRGGTGIGRAENGTAGATGTPGAGAGTAGGLYGVRDVRDTWRRTCSTYAPLGHRAVEWVRVAPSVVVDTATGRLAPTRLGAVEGLKGRTYYGLLRSVADALETGRPFDGHRPAAVDGVLRWVPSPTPR
ncbi:hypothetical protein [Sinosporangium album]|uniref:hypothetical protein n=1 Tax=Sinosporangium album TaxID=504805 RepID=UPI00115FC457|nr:hypothetical protein [Sinosporangium album]